ncbi:GNAT family N-acetyltransferase [Achromobacter insolitus]|uniref:GNAT family N-acetyltransferase n=1 Tax=Achromobacter insolitus TaxID=217204 RepID=UPI0028B0B953|nr:hypothetical protein [Achromobacter insolitus]
MTAIVDPHDALVGFESALRKGILHLIPVPRHSDLLVHFDEPTPGIIRMTYVRLTEDSRAVKSLLMCVGNGKIDGYPCMSFGIAVGEPFRNQGLAKQIVKDVIGELAIQARDLGYGRYFFEAVIAEDNIASQRLAQGTIGGVKERITDSASGLPALRWTGYVDAAPQ